MSRAIATVGVVGAGVMGAAIAAHAANAGCPVVLLDRDDLAAAALPRLLAADPPPFMTRDAARLVSPGSLAADLTRLGECDWIVEAVVEDAAVKRALYRRVEAVRRPGSIVSSNTSTLTLAGLMEDMPETLAGDFLVTHFFNPPRHMRLLELVTGERTRPEAAAAVRDFADRRLGKTVVEARDTPGFIANRIGVFWLLTALGQALAFGLDVEDADDLLGRSAGFPRTGVFALLDLVGLDVALQVADSLSAVLPPAESRVVALLAGMVAGGRTGRKGGGGFYRRRDGLREVLDLTTGAYRPRRKPERPAAAEDFVWAVVGPTLAYAATVMPEIAPDVAAVDTALRLGYNWRAGPFGMIDAMGPAVFAERLRRARLEVPPLLERLGGERFLRVVAGKRQALAADGLWRDLPPRPPTLADVKAAGPPVEANASASLWDVGDGVLCLEFHSKRNTIGAATLEMVRRAVALEPTALVIHNEGEEFSAGADIAPALFAANIAAWDAIEDMVRAGQDAFAALRRAPFPVVGAPSGAALGGGCEILLACDAIQAHAECYLGLVESGLGLVPAWGGCTAMLRRRMASPRARGPMPAVAEVFETLWRARVSTSAADARALGFLCPADGITMNRDRLLAEAKARALSMVPDYAPPSPAELALPGPSGAVALGLAIRAAVLAGKGSEHDARVGTALADVLSGGSKDLLVPRSEAEVLTLERQAFMGLIRHPATLARVEAMLETGRPLRN